MSNHQIPEHSMKAVAAWPGRMRSAGVVGVAGVAGIAMGLGATSLALWNDEATFTGTISSGYEYFAAGIEGETLTPASDDGAPPTGNSVDVSVGAPQAQILADEGQIAIAFQVDSLSQGNKGLEYTLSPPTDWGEGYFGSSDVSIYWVDDPSECVVGADGPGLPADGHVVANTDGTFISTPVSAAYSTTTTPTTEYWCLRATLGGLPDEGEYENTAKVTANGPAGTEVSDQDSWNADVTTALDPAEEGDHTITFSYETFRPGEVTTP